MQRDVGIDRPCFNDFVAASLRMAPPNPNARPTPDWNAEAVLLLDLPSDDSQFIASGPLRDMVNAGIVFRGKDWFDRLRIVSEGSSYSINELAGIAVKTGIIEGN